MVDNVGIGGIALSNGNYIVLSALDSFFVVRGAVTFGNGTSGITGVVDDTNSLVGNVDGDAVGSGGLTALSLGNYMIESPDYEAIVPLVGATLSSAGAATLGDGTDGTRDKQEPVRVPQG